MLRYDVAQLKASAAGRPAGYVEHILEKGKILGEFVFLSDSLEAELSKLFAPARFSIAQLNADAKRLPEGFAEFVRTHGKLKGRDIELDLTSLDALHEKFPVRTMTTPKEPTLAEMTASFTKAAANWAKAGFRVVDRQIFEKRHRTCKACEFWLPDARLGIGKCLKCGCSIYKLWLATSRCPLTPPKWT